MPNDLPQAPDNTSATPHGRTGRGRPRKCPASRADRFQGRWAASGEARNPTGRARQTPLQHHYSAATGDVLRFLKLAARHPSTPAELRVKASDLVRELGSRHRPEPEFMERARAVAFEALKTLQVSQ